MHCLCGNGRRAVEMEIVSTAKFLEKQLNEDGNKIRTELEKTKN